MDESGIEATQALDFGDYEDDITDDEPDESTPVAYLNVACQKGFPGKVFPVYEGDNVIGRGEECKISVPMKALSREHACIEVKGDSHFIYDKGSRNRTRRNKHFLAASVRYELKNKDKLIFGDVESEYQIGSQAADDGDETGSESMFQTAPDDEELDNSVETNERTEDKPPDEEDYASDASSDILEPTQPFAGNTQSMLGNRVHNGNSTLAQNITVKDTPAAHKTKRFTEDIVLPESDSDTDGERSTKPPATLAIVADSQDDEDEDDNVKSKMMGAATQAYVCESDVTTDEEDSIVSKKSLLSAPTQAFLDDDVSTCSEDSPQKRSLLTAATQAFVADSDDDKTPSKKRQAKIAPTVAYDMDEGIEPTQGYDMDEETDDEKQEKEEEEQKSSGILFEPTQAYLGSKAPDDQDNVDDAKSDTSEEFVLEGDTDAEDSNDDGEILAAPTLACDVPDEEEGETQVVSTEEPTQVIGGKAEDDATVAVGEEATQVFDEPETKKAGRNRKVKADETVPVCEAETQVFQGNEDSDIKPHVSNDDATQVFDEDTKGRKEQRKSAESNVAETQVFDENATQVFDNDHDTKSVQKNKMKNEQTAETQVFNVDATQCFDDRNDENIKDTNEVETQVFDEPLKIKTGKKADTSECEEMATQVFDKDDGVSDGEGQTFDITAASTLAFNEEAAEESETEEVDAVAGGDDATQVFDGADSTVAVSDDQTFPVESETTQNKSRRGRAKQCKVDETVAVTDDATQVFEDKPVQTKAVKGRKKQGATTNDTIAVSDDATQVFDETVAVEEVESKSKSGSRKRGKKKEHTAKEENNDDATQVFDETVAIGGDDQTVAVEDIESKTKLGSKRQGKKKEHVVKQDNNEDATQVFDETVAVEEIDKHQGKGKSHTGKTFEHDDATQVFEENSDTSESGKQKRKSVKGKSTHGNETEQATQIFEETLQVAKSKESEKKILKNKANVRTRKKVQEEPTQIIDDTVPVSEEMEINFEDTENENAECCKTEEATQVFEKGTDTESEEKEVPVETKGKRTRGNRQANNKNVKENVAKTNVNKQSEILESCEKANDVASTNVRKSSRTRGKATFTKKDEVVTEKSSKTVRTKSKKGELAEESKGSDQDEGKGRKAGKGKRKEEPEFEPATQIYADSESSDGIATQRYGEAEDEVATQRYGEVGDEVATQRYGEVEDDDLTPDINEIEDEKIDEVPVVKVDPSRGRSPLKSAIASPKKKKSPSPKKVQFVSQNSESSSESGETSRRSRRGKGVGKLELETDPVSEEGKEQGRKGIKTAAVPQTKRLTRQKHVNTEENIETENNDLTSEKLEENQMTDDNVEHRTVLNKRQTRGKKVNTEKNSENESDSKVKNESVESDSKSKDEVIVKSNRRGRKSVDTAVNVERENITRKTRTSLPAVLEESKPETSQKSGETKDGQSVDEKHSVIKSKGKGRKNMKGKSKTGGQEEIENKQIDDSEHDLKHMSKQVESDLSNANEGITNDNLRDNKDSKQTSETEPSDVLEHEENRTNRQTRTNVQVKKTRNLKETKSDTTNNDTEASEGHSTRSNRTSRKKETIDADDKEVDHLKKKRNLDHVKADGDKSEPSPQTLSRTRTRKTGSVGNDPSETKHDLETEDVVKNKTKGKVGKGNKSESNKSETTDNNSSETKQDIVLEEAVKTDNKCKVKSKVGKGSKGKDEKDKTVTSNSMKSKHDEEEEESEQTDIAHKGVTGKGGKGKGKKVEPETVEQKVKLEQIKEDVNDESKGPTRSKRGRANKAVPKEEKEEETSIENNNTSRSQRLKRKESASSPNDSQESDLGETPAKRQKKKTDNHGTTPKPTGKQASAVSTPRGASTKQLETSVTHSPTLRKTTVEGSKPKVMFTGVVDEQGEKIVKELGGELVSSVTDCTHLVTDQVRRTVKFLCCLSRGGPIVSPQWLMSSKASGFFLDPAPFLVKDDASERKYKFCLAQSIEKAQKDRLFRGYTFKITQSVKPEPQHMKDILKCAGATKFVDKMPDKPYPPLTVVISCPDDQAQCEPAYKVGIPVMTAEFVLTGILRQEVDLRLFQLEKKENGNKRQANTLSQETTKKRKR
ncbi:mediator of DNA damage checkpoint protein 1-like isoform X2 [Mercenaria mercenaria]|uniref:mediator of DNA damage checkpoint protein 1-like isoform X2 n=1 Tax=Mercenaria mercenaria TaxID=6596 RepID=UPI00234EEDC9|nr:mediator of DNA damage checkpoint protein 1-like isoform X2 [Mercenaria mercenaria]